jgi:glycosyl transferase family 87
VRRLALPALLALALVPAASAGTAPTAPVYDSAGRLVQTPFAPAGEPQQLTKAQATAIVLANDKIADWLRRYPHAGRTTDATYTAEDGSWTVHVWWRDAGEIARGRVDDDTKAVLEAWTGPQVAWSMARGYDGAFGGKELNNPVLWIALSALFFLGLADLRRLRSARNLDLLALLSFGISLAFFNAGDIFTSVPLAYPPLVYLIGRMVWIGMRGRAPAAGRPVWPVWALAAVTVFLVGFRIGLNTEASSVIDVGYAGVIGAQRISNGEAPYGHMPIEDDLTPCGPSNAEGAFRERVQTNGRCETANETGDTYGPVSYQAYLPGYWLFGWPGRWDDLPAAHFTSIAWDLIVLLGLFLVGRRFGGWRLAATLAFGWAAFPFTQYASNANTNDAIMPAFLVWGFWLVSSPVARGASTALAAWTKLVALIVVPLWATYPDGVRRPRATVIFAAAFALTTAAAFWVLLLEPNPFHAARLFWDRTFVSQFDRESPFSLWDWGQYHARGIPDLKLVQRVLIGLVGAAGVVFAFVPRRKSPLQLAALTAVLVLAFELVLTHWFYLYIAWFLPFVLVAVLAPAVRRGTGVPVRDRVPPRLSSERRAAAVGTGAILLLLGSWALLHHGVWNRIVITDVPVYESYGEALARGEVPYRDFAVAYPPGALPAFALPTIGDGSDGYRLVFEALMWLCAAAALVCMLVTLRALGRRGPPVAAALAFAAVAPLLLGSVVRSRFDYLPAAIVTAAIAALLTRRERVGCAALAIGAAVKVYPALLMPLALAYVWRRLGRREAQLCALVSAGTLAAVVLPFAVLSPGGLWDTVSVHATRGLQIESLGAGLLLAAHHLTGVGLEVGSSAGSQNLTGTGADVLAVIHSLAQLAVVAALWIRFARGRADPERFVRYSAAAICAFVAFGKVLSPQFLIWLLPLVPLVGGRRGAVATGLLGLAAVLTQLWFPTRYWDLVNDFDAAASWLVLGRDLLLLAIVAVLVVPVRALVARRVRAEPAAATA